MPCEVYSISMRGLRLLSFAAVVVAASAVCPAAFAVPPEDATTIERGIGEFVAGMEASFAAKRMDYGELTVSLFVQAHGRAPSPAEFFVVRDVAETFSATPEEVLSLVLREDQPGPTWEQCRRFLERSGAKQFEAPSDAAALAAALAATPREELLAEMDAADGAKDGAPGADGGQPQGRINPMPYNSRARRGRGPAAHHPRRSGGLPHLFRVLPRPQRAFAGR